MPERNGDDDRVRAFWSGTISFGLVSIPVELYPANRTVRVSLRMLAPDGTPLSRRYFCPEDEREIGWQEIVRGYELEDRFIVLTDEELEALEPRKSRDIDLRLFVDRDEIDPVWFERAWYLAPSGDSTKAYRLLAETMERTGRAGIATFVMRTKEYLVAILPDNGLLRAETMRFHDELRAPEDVGLPEPLKPQKKEVGKLETAIRALEKQDIAAGELKNRNAERLLRVIEAKHAAGEDVVEGVVSEEPAEDESVIDLMEVLKRRLARRSAARAGNGRSARSDGDLEGLTKKQLYERAKDLDIEGRSSMSREDLLRAIRRTA